MCVFVNLPVNSHRSAAHLPCSWPQGRTERNRRMKGWEQCAGGQVGNRKTSEGWRAAGNEGKDEGRFIRDVRKRRAAAGVWQVDTEKHRKYKQERKRFIQQDVAGIQMRLQGRRWAQVLFLHFIAHVFCSSAVCSFVVVYCLHCSASCNLLQGESEDNWGAADSRVLHQTSVLWHQCANRCVN